MKSAYWVTNTVEELLLTIVNNRNTISHKVESHGIVHALRINGLVTPTGHIVILDEISQKTKILEVNDQHRHNTKSVSEP